MELSTFPTEQKARQAFPLRIKELRGAQGSHMVFKAELSMEWGYEVTWCMKEGNNVSQSKRRSIVVQERNIRVHAPLAAPCCHGAWEKTLALGGGNPVDAIKLLMASFPLHLTTSRGVSWENKSMGVRVHTIEWLEDFLRAI